MSHFKSHLHQKVTAVFFLAIAILFLYSTSFAETGVTQHNITLGSHQPMSGPASEFSAIGKSAQAYFQFVNDQGGVHGRSIDLKIVDDRFQPKIAREAISNLILRYPLFAHFSGIGTKSHREVYPLIRSQHMPSFFVGSDHSEWTNPKKNDVFAFMPTPETEGRVYAKFLNEKFSNKSVIIWHSDTAQYKNAAQALTDGLRGVPAKLLPSKARNYTAEWNLIRQNRPSLLIALGSFKEVVEFLKAGEPVDITVFIGHAFADSRLPKWVSANTLKYLRVLTAFPLISEINDSGIQFHKKILKEYEPNLTANRWSIYGHAVAELMVEVLERSGRKLTREQSITSSESIYNWQGSLMPRVFLSRNNHLAITSLRVSQIKPGRVVHFSDWIDGR